MDRAVCQRCRGLQNSLDHWLENETPETQIGLINCYRASPLRRSRLRRPSSFSHKSFRHAMTPPKTMSLPDHLARWLAALPRRRKALWVGLAMAIGPITA